MSPSGRFTRRRIGRARIERSQHEWARLVRGFTGGDVGIARALKAKFEAEPTIHGQDTAELRAKMAYVHPAFEPDTASRRRRT